MRKSSTIFVPAACVVFRLLDCPPTSPSSPPPPASSPFSSSSSPPSPLPLLSSSRPCFCSSPLPHSPLPFKSTTGLSACTQCKSAVPKRMDKNNSPPGLACLRIEEKPVTLLNHKLQVTENKLLQQEESAQRMEDVHREYQVKLNAVQDKLRQTEKALQESKDQSQRINDRMKLMHKIQADADEAKFQAKIKDLQRKHQEAIDTIAREQQHKYQQAMDRLKQQTIKSTKEKMLASLKKLQDENKSLLSKLSLPQLAAGASTPPLARPRSSSSCCSCSGEVAQLKALLQRAKLEAVEVSKREQEALLASAVALSKAQAAEVALMEQKDKPPAFPAIINGLSSLAEYDLKTLLQAVTDELNHRKVCVVCLDVPASVVFLPCQHMKVCEKCSPSLSACPICRTKISNRFQPY
eukprot:gb/GEZN01000782.1/.p2 GENE.gb/GEZN01000782.1/~~gb/GEZN01000782.1/.p2  ORF type:complete len:409 (+),score=106.87 gb/GEZN01000782.1/:2476-3702(+)